jgi:hypothetical protein
LNLFEFNDLPWIPGVFRETLLDLMEFCNRGFRSFNQWAAGQALDYARRQRCRTIVELGAGSGPMTQLLAGRAEKENICLVPCDLFPDLPGYRAMQQQHPGTVRPVFEPVDFSQPHDFGPSAAAVLVGTFHHIPQGLRSETLRALTQSARHVMVFEPLRNTLLSILLVFTAIFPALLLPFYRFGSAGTLRRILWCWLIPVIPFMFLWDGVVSCLREWSPRRWKEELARVVGPGRQPEIRAWVHATAVSW